MKSDWAAGSPGWARNCGRSKGMRSPPISGARGSSVSHRVAPSGVFLAGSDGGYGVGGQGYGRKAVIVEADAVAVEAKV